MAAYLRQRPPMWFWIVATLITLWGVTGVFFFYTQTNPSDAALAAMSEYDRAFFRNQPDWFAWAYGAATWGGLLGGLMLLVRRRLAALFFAISLVAIVVQFGWAFAATDLIAVKGAGTAVPFPVFIAAIGAFQLWFTDFAKRRGWVL